MSDSDLSGERIPRGYLPKAADYQKLVDLVTDGNQQGTLERSCIERHSSF